MNHCIPNRKLQPESAPRWHGVVVTPSLNGPYLFYVRRNGKQDGGRLFRMPDRLFKHTAEDREKYKNGNWSRSQFLRREELPEYGDNIAFTADETTMEILDYEEESKNIVADVLYGQPVMEAIGVVQGGEDPHLWTNIFGLVHFRDRQDARHNLDVAMHDVAIKCWIAFDIQMDGNLPMFFTKFHSFIGIDPDERQEAWQTDWNLSRPRVMYVEDVDDEECIYAQEKDTTEELNITTKRNGILTGRLKVFATDTALRDEDVYVGLIKDTYAPGYRIEFDAYYSDLLNAYVIYKYEVLAKAYDAHMHNADDARMQIQISLGRQLGRFYVHHELGLISDREHKLGTLSGPNSKVFTGDVTVFVTASGSKEANDVARFEIVQLAEETEKFVAQADDRAGEYTAKSRGVVVNPASGLVYSAQYPFADFYLPTEDPPYDAGEVITFQGRYVKQRGYWEIFAGEGVDVAHYGCVENNHRQFVFKVDVERHAQNAALLCNTHFGVVGKAPEKVPLKKNQKICGLIRENYKEDAQIPCSFLQAIAKNADISKIDVSHINRRANGFTSNLLPNACSEAERAALKANETGAMFCETENVKNRRRCKQRERGEQKQKAGKSVWDARLMRYDPPKPPPSYQRAEENLSDDEEFDIPPHSHTANGSWEQPAPHQSSSQNSTDRHNGYGTANGSLPQASEGAHRLTTTNVTRNGIDAFLADEAQDVYVQNQREEPEEEESNFELERRLRLLRRKLKKECKVSS